MADQEFENVKGKKSKLWLIPLLTWWLGCVYTFCTGYDISSNDTPIRIDFFRARYYSILDTDKAYVLSLFSSWPTSLTSSSASKHITMTLLILLCHKQWSPAYSSFCLYKEQCNYITRSLSPGPLHRASCPDSQYSIHKIRTVYTKLQGKEEVLRFIIQPYSTLHAIADYPAHWPFLIDSSSPRRWMP